MLQNKITARQKPGDFPRKLDLSSGIYIRLRVNYIKNRYNKDTQEKSNDIRRLVTTM